MRPPIAIGLPWWSQAVLDLLPPKTSLGSLERGRSLARDGMVGELHLEPGRVAANVGALKRSGMAALSLPAFDAAERERALDVMAASVRHLAALADSALDPRLLDDLDRAELPLLPNWDQAIWEDEVADQPPGMHAVALAHAMAGAVGQDPFLLLELRGFGRADDIVRAIRRRRAGDQALDDDAGLGAAVVARTDAFWVGTSLNDITVHPKPLGHGALLVDRLGMPPRVDDADRLDQLVQRSAETAWKLAAGAGAGAADDEVLLAELRAARMATAASLAETLGWVPADMAAALDRLFGEGKVLRTGTDDSARYRAT